MLIKRISSLFSKRATTDQFSYKRSPFTQAQKQIQELRNIDYGQQRKKVISDFNKKIQKIRQIYKEELKISKSKGLTQQKQEEQSIKILDDYHGKINVCSNELTKMLNNIKLRQKENTVKIYLAENIKYQKETSQTVYKNHHQGFYIPNRLVLKKLYLCSEKDGKNSDQRHQVLLVGVQNQEEHCLFLNKLIDEFNIKNLVTMVAPDLPYFIKTEDSFMQEWKQFIEKPKHAQKTKFYVNPKPKKLQDICLNSIHFSLVRQALGRSSSFANTHYCLLKQNQLTNEFQPMPLLSGLCNQNLNNIYLADYPIFQERKMLADNLQLNHLRSLFQEFLRNFKKLQFKFSAQWLFPAEILRKKQSHTVKVAKAVARQRTGRTMLMCPAEIAELLSIQWQLKSEDSQVNNSQLIFDFEEEGGVENQTFMQHIEKLVILDLIIDPVITKYFARYRSFPFLCHHTIGGKQHIGKIFIIWSHYYNIYHSLLSEKRLESKKEETIRANFMERFQDPTDFT